MMSAAHELAPVLGAAHPRANGGALAPTLAMAHSSGLSVRARRVLAHRWRWTPQSANAC
jgi:hypothetical protein